VVVGRSTRVARVAVVILAVALGVAVVVAAIAAMRARALTGQVASLTSRAEQAEAEVAAAGEREAALGQRLDEVEAARAQLEGTVAGLEGTVAGLEAERTRLQASVDDSSGELARLDEQMAALRDDLANAQEAAREADAAAVAAVAQADATHDDLVRARTEAEALQVELDELRAMPEPPSSDERPEVAPLLVEGLWALERSRTERTWRQSVTLDPGGPGPFVDGGDPARVAVEVEAAAVREDVGAVIEVDWQVDGPLAPADGLLLLRSAQELLARASRTVEDGVLVVARDGDDLVLSLLGPGREVLDLDGAVVRLAPG
jgi:hypothetical protein